jgi:tripartite-type tricarboxylate transporter receptor subunit TctC
MSVLTLTRNAIAGAILSATLATGAMANECKMVIDFPAGGALDFQARLMMKANPDFQNLEYRVGGMSTLAIRFLEDNKDFAFFGSPSAFGANSPMKNPPIELVKIVLSAPLHALTNKGVTWEQLTTGKINLGIPGLGTSHHVLALQLKEINPNIEIIPTGGDNKALPMIVNKDLDVYLVSATNGVRWAKDHNLETIFTIALGEKFKRGNISLTSVAFNGIFVHKDATPEQKAHVMACVDRAVKSDVWINTLKDVNVTPLNIDGAEKDRLFNQYVGFMKKYGL